jgi:hypothetical protein
MYLKHHFYKGLKELAEKLDINFEPKYVMQDAQRSSFNAVKEVFPDVKVLKETQKPY